MYGLSIHQSVTGCAAVIVDIICGTVTNVSYICENDLILNLLYLKYLIRKLWIFEQKISLGAKIWFHFVWIIYWVKYICASNWEFKKIFWWPNTWNSDRAIDSPNIAIKRIQKGERTKWIKFWKKWIFFWANDRQIQIIP